MAKGYRFALALAWGLVAAACSSNNMTGGTAGTTVFPAGTGGTGVAPGSGGTSSGTAGMSMTSGMAGTGATAGMGGKAGTSGMAGMTASAGKGGTGGGAGGGSGTGTSGAGGAAGSAAGTGAGGSSGGTLTGTLGALGPAKPVMAGFATTNGFESLIYLSSSANLTCALMAMQGVKWLGMLPAGTQVVEIVLEPNPMMKMYSLGSGPAAFGGAEVNYAEGSKSSSSEVMGSAGTVTITKAMAMGVHEGMINITAPFMLSGSFHAEWCQGGTEF